MEWVSEQMFEMLKVGHPLIPCLEVIWCEVESLHCTYSYETSCFWITL